MEVVVEEDVDVDDAVVVLSVDGLVLSPHVAFYLLGLVQEVEGGEGCFDADGGIEEGVGALKSPWPGGKEGGLCLDRSNPPSYFRNGGQEVVFLVAKVCAE